jgi:hypothetical protein
MITKRSPSSAVIVKGHRGPVNCSLPSAEAPCMESSKTGEPRCHLLSEINLHKLRLFTENTRQQQVIANTENSSGCESPRTQIATHYAGAYTPSALVLKS